MALFLASGKKTTKKILDEFDSFAADESSYVNGQNWAVDGGLSASHPVIPGKVA